MISTVFLPALLPACLSVSMLLLRPALASLYPTQPISTTVYTAGQPAQLKWIDDSHKPSLDKMGLLKIDLFAEVNTYLTTLARNVSAHNKSLQVVIPAEMGHGLNAPYFTMRFISEKPPMTVYTARFKITNTATNFTSNTPPSLTISPSATATTHKEPLPTLDDPGAHAYNSNKRVDLEKAKFRLVFILWPTLIGITMAL